MIDKFITNELGKVIINTTSDLCQQCINSCKTNSAVIESCSVHVEKRRQGKIESTFGVTYICSNDIDLIRSSRIFKEKLKIYDELKVELADIKLGILNDSNQNTKRLIHNLTSINAHSIQELYSLIPQELLTKNFKNQITVIEDLILNEPREAAHTFLRIAKNNASMKTEFSVFSKLYESNPILQSQKHHIRKVIFNLLYIFFPDFTDQGIYVEVQENYDQLVIDYESMHVAFYHLIENAAKYAMPNNPISISFANNQRDYCIDFTMMSLRIGQDEKMEIFSENYSGKFARIIENQAMELA